MTFKGYHWFYSLYTLFCRKLKYNLTSAFLLLIFWDQIRICANQITFCISDIDAKKITCGEPFGPVVAAAGCNDRHHQLL